MIVDADLKFRQRAKNNSATPNDKDIFSIQPKKLAQQAIVQ
jgi:hypothetical protein